MDGAKHHYKKLALRLHPDKGGGSATDFVHLNVLYDLLQTADKKTAAAQASAQRAFTETANARNDLNANIHTFNARLAAQTLAVQAQWARWHHEKIAVAATDAAGRHSSELASAQHRIKQVEKQLHRSQANEEKYAKEVEKMSAKRKRFDAVDEEGQYFAPNDPSLERETKRLKEWESKLAAERRSQRGFANKWRTGTRNNIYYIILLFPHHQKTAILIICSRTGGAGRPRRNRRR